MTCIITCLWGIFAWASLSLGFKASNLTNRGIVTKGPYRWVRHPAYAAKLGIWLIQLVFFWAISARFVHGICANLFFESLDRRKTFIAKCQLPEI